MLGEDHSLAHDFPQLAGTIIKLNQSDSDFAAENQRYTALDKEIRDMELSGSPASDERMNQLKIERAKLKDVLYKRLVDATGCL
ncbi:YdcH family protein [Aliagarivorans taiwanensis]|uniref:YdcH family protein n=1 Tax=Aliagarivorans taiwanensis TaxID=561966 RepID=UPI0004275587|nr:YdcH family protein [Aliagarivorans taiwanensis]